MELRKTEKTKTTQSLVNGKQYEENVLELQLLAALRQICPLCLIVVVELSKTTIVSEVNIAIVCNSFTGFDKCVSAADLCIRREIHILCLRVHSAVDYFAVTS